jgi:hypothetical protein
MGVLGMNEEELAALVVRMVEALERIADALNPSQTITDTEEQFQKSVGVRDDG